MTQLLLVVDFVIEYSTESKTMYLVTIFRYHHWCIITDRFLAGQ